MNNIINEQPVVSIIMNCFNGETFLKESINSVLSQTYKNWEIIFWNNQSQDKSAEIFKSFHDKRFKYFLAKEHTSLYMARNLAIKKTKGSLIAFLDTDDYWSKDKLKNEIETFLNNPESMVVYGNYFIVNEKLKIKKLAHKNETLKSGLIYKDLLKNYNIGFPTVMVRQKIFKKLNFKFDERFEIIGDFDLMIKLSKNYKFSSLKKPIAYYRTHNQNTSLLSKKRHYEEMKIWTNENFFKDKDLNNNIYLKKKYVNLLNELKFISILIEGKKLEAIKVLLNFNNDIKKIKYFLSIFLPLNILKKFINF